MFRVLLLSIGLVIGVLAASEGHAANACSNLFSLPRAKQLECLKRREKAIARAEAVCNRTLRGRSPDEISRCITREIERAGF
jgi:hypothetical protein